MNILEKLQEIETYIGSDLYDGDAENIIDYLNDDPISTDVPYLVELFDLINLYRSNRA